jgi:hypothetical protein
VPTLRRRYSVIELAFWTALSTHLFACSTYHVQPVESAEKIGGRYFDTSVKDISLRVVPLSPEEAKSYLGFDVEKDEMLPVFLQLENGREAPIRIDEALMSVETTSGVECRSLPIEESTSRALRSGTGEVVVVFGSAVFGVVGMLIASDGLDKHTTVNRTIEEDYDAKKLQPAILITDAGAKGVVFFDMKDCQDGEPARLTLKFTDLQSGEAIVSDIDWLDRDHWHQSSMAEDGGQEDR